MPSHIVKGTRTESWTWDWRGHQGVHYLNTLLMEVSLASPEEGDSLPLEAGHRIFGHVYRNGLPVLVQRAELILS